MYVDFEYTYADNPDLEESKVLDTLVTLLCHALNTDYKVSADRSKVLVLVSCSPPETSQPVVKSSYHLVFHLERFVFEDNSVCGGFMNDVYEDLKKYLSTEQPSKYLPHPQLPRSALHQLLVKNGTKSQFVADLSVYSSNRQFR